ncbi:MAG: DUF4352 domain-containing protein [Dehalococcoidia bacterium]|nr:DUF4352 domain-containing protein [Dehalococcoidia bacterium]
MRSPKRASRRRSVAPPRASSGGDLHDAYDAYSKECREQTPYTEFAAGMTLAEAFMEAFTGAKLKDIKVKDVEVRNFSGDRGEVKLVVEARDIEGFDEGQEEEWSEWVWEDGKWVQTDCGDLGPGGVLGGGDDAAPSDDEPQPVPTPGAGPAIGTAVEAGGSRYTVHSIEDPAKAGEYFGPDPGKRWVVIEVTQEALDRQVSGSPSTSPSRTVTASSTTSASARRSRSSPAASWRRASASGGSSRSRCRKTRSSSRSGSMPPSRSRTR